MSVMSEKTTVIFILMCYLLLYYIHLRRPFDPECCCVFFVLLDDVDKYNISRHIYKYQCCIIYPHRLFELGVHFVVFYCVSLCCVVEYDLIKTFSSCNCQLYKS